MYIHAEAVKDKIINLTVFKLYKNKNEQLIGLKWECTNSDFNYFYKRVKMLGAKWNGLFWEFKNKHEVNNFFEFDNIEELNNYIIQIVGKELLGKKITIYRYKESNSGFVCSSDIELAILFIDNLWLQKKRLNTNNVLENSFVIVENIDEAIIKIEKMGGLVVLEDYFPKNILIEDEKYFFNLKCNTNEPMHYFIRKKFGKTFYWVGEFPNGQKTPIFWDGKVILPFPNSSKSRN